jgi:hypothetical protein
LIAFQLCLQPGAQLNRGSTFRLQGSVQILGAGLRRCGEFPQALFEPAGALDHGLGPGQFFLARGKGLRQPIDLLL